MEIIPFDKLESFFYGSVSVNTITDGKGFKMKRIKIKKYIMVLTAVIGLTAAAPGAAGAATTGENAAASQLEVRFGDNGAAFTMKLEDNDTAAAIKKHVGTADWRLPIYHYDDYDHWEEMQYYDISRRYEIPSDNAKTVASEKAGEVYYSHPNRIILFYEDAEVTGEYTKIGEIEATDDFKKAVKDNPVLRGWGNKIVQIKNIK